MAINTWTLTDVERGLYEAEFSLDARDLGGPASEFSIHKKTLRGGLSDGVDVIKIDNGQFRAVVVPTRGMGLWKAWLGDLELGWKSPVPGPVNPAYVPVSEPSGLGWLDGFDELLCRCGLESNGAPEFDDKGCVTYPLHGRVANLPARKVEVSFDSDTGEIRVTGVVDENRFHFRRLQLTSTLITRLGQPGVKIVDEIKNLSGRPAGVQMLYHINFGHPLVDPGARLVAPIKTIVPRTAHAAAGIDTWDSYPNEKADAEEQVYFFDLAAGSDGRTKVLLKNAHGVQGVSLGFNKSQLPCFSLWKNCPSAADGYVTGLEPGTNYPNPRSHEKEQKRVIELGPGQAITMEVTIDAHPDAASVHKVEAEIAKIQQGVTPQVHRAPQKGWVA